MSKWLANIQCCRIAEHKQLIQMRDHWKLCVKAENHCTFSIADFPFQCSVARNSFCQSKLCFWKEPFFSSYDLFSERNFPHGSCLWSWSTAAWKLLVQPMIHKIFQIHVSILLLLILSLQWESQSTCMELCSI